jgi:DNA-binding XRE family transcriptional regulator
MSTNLSNNIKRLRKNRRLTQAQLALELKKGQTTIGNWETGFSEPGVEELQLLSNFFGVSVDILINQDLAHVNLSDLATSVENVNLNVNPHVNLKTENGVSQGGVSVIEQSRKRKQPERVGASHFMPRVITVDNQGKENAIYVPVKARAGYLAGYGDPEYLEKLPAYRLPGMDTGTYRIFEVDGVSMFNTLQDKDRVIARWSPISEIRDDRVHVLITKTDGILIKRILNRLEERKLVCKSDNNHRGEYPPIVIDVYEVLEAWYVVERWTRQLPNPGEIYKRIVDLEADMAIIKHKMLKG